MPKAAVTRAAVAAGLLGVLIAVQADLLGLSPAVARPIVRTLLLAAEAALGVAAIRSLLAAAFSEVRGQAILVWRNLTAWTLYALLALEVAAGFGINLSGLLVGGAIVGVVLASVSQASLGNFFAGLVLMLARPFCVGDTVRLRTSLVGGVEFEGTVVDSRALYTTLLTADGELLRIPNSAVIASVLVVGGAPLRVDVQLELPADTSLAEIEERVRRRLSGSGVRVDVRPISLSTLDRAALVCRVTVRSTESVPPELVTEAVAAAVRAA